MDNIIICYRCGEAIPEAHGNRHYHEDCAYQEKKDRSIRQHAAKSLQADPLWSNEKILREYFFKYGSGHEVDPNDLESAGFNFQLLTERNINGKVIFCAHHYGISFLINKKIIICKI